jgi:hypothetical protein
MQMNADVRVETLEINHQRGFEPAFRRDGGLRAGKKIEPLNLLNDREINAGRTAILQFQRQRSPERDLQVASQSKRDRLNRTTQTERTLKRRKRRAPN